MSKRLALKRLSDLESQLCELSASIPEEGEREISMEEFHAYYKWSASNPGAYYKKDPDLQWDVDYFFEKFNRDF